MKKYKLFIIFFFVQMLSSCSNASEEDLLIPIEEIETVTFVHVKPIIDNNCISCHANPPINAAPMSLISYQEVKEAVQNRNLLQRIQLQQGEEGAMPLNGPRLPQNLIDVILQWNEDGLVE